MIVESRFDCLPDKAAAAAATGHTVDRIYDVVVDFYVHTHAHNLAHRAEATQEGHVNFLSRREVG